MLHSRLSLVKQDLVFFLARIRIAMSFGLVSIIGSETSQLAGMSVCRSFGRLASLSVTISQKDGKFHINAPIRELYHR